MKSRDVTGSDVIRPEVGDSPWGVILFVLKPNPKEDLNVLYHQPITSLEIEPIRLQEMHQPKEDDFIYVRVPTIYIVRESSLAFWIFDRL